MKSCPSASPASNTGTMFGWSRPAASCDSRTKRDRKASSAASSGARTLIATRRASRVSSARYTTLMPPRPSSDSMRYGPNDEPGTRSLTWAFYQPRAADRRLRAVSAQHRMARRDDVRGQELPRELALGRDLDLGDRRRRALAREVRPDEVAEPVEDRPPVVAVHRLEPVRVVAEDHVGPGVDHAVGLVDLIVA